MSDAVLDSLVAEAAADDGSVGLVLYLVRARFALERRWPPYHDRLATQLSSLAEQGRADSLGSEPPAVLRTADPARRRDLEARVEQLMESRGVLAHDEWGNGLDRAKRG